MKDGLDPFIKPRYAEGRCFSSYPAEVERLLSTHPSSGATRKVIFIFLDAFGWRFFHKFKHHSDLLMRFQRDGSVTKNTSQFPSTTACHLTTLHFGLPVAKTGIFEWNYYEPLAQGMISPLMFSWAGEKQRETLVQEGFSADTIFPFETFYSKLAKQGVPSFIFQNKNYTPSAYSNRAFAPAKIFPYATEQEGMRTLAQTVQETGGSGYFFLYLDSFDDKCHTEGPSSEQAETALTNVLHDLESLVVKELQGKVKDTVLLLGSDHGQVEMDPEKTFFIDQEIPESAEWMRTSDSGKLLVPGGSARDMFLYIRPNLIEHAETVLRQQLGDVARVLRVSQLINEGFFGQEVSTRLRERLSELVVLPYAGESVWWSGENGKYKKPFKGSHGGLTPQEMEIPLLQLEL